MEFGAAESKSLIRRKTVKVGAGQPELFYAFTSAAFCNFENPDSSRNLDLILKQAET